MLKDPLYLIFVAAFLVGLAAAWTAPLSFTGHLLWSAVALIALGYISALFRI